LIVWPTMRRGTVANRASRRAAVHPDKEPHRA
jgi:hypothetical protein